MPQQISLFEYIQNGNFGSILQGGGYKIRSRKKLSHRYKDIVSIENLSLAWDEFIVGKKNRRDVLRFSGDLMDNIVELHDDLVNLTYDHLTYDHGGYKSFYINDPKRRHIHKASVRDRLLHRAVYRILYPFFDKTFIVDSFSCRKEKGLHKALNKFKELFNKVSKNKHCTCWVLKCDIRKFFASIDHQILLDILDGYIPDKDIVWLLKNIVESYHTNCYSRENGNQALDSAGVYPHEGGGGDDKCKIGLPLGNLTSQLFSNVYMNVFDQFVKHKLKVKHYIRYADDFVFLSTDKKYLENLIPKADNFLNEKLKLTLHPNKIFLRTIFSGVDFLGWVYFSNYHILRKVTKKRMLRRIKQNPTFETLQSYLGLLQHGYGQSTKKELLGEYWLWSN
ncbi:MAG: RNA-directed DNA polymerase [Candidatus Magasanikbacteria bacterium GW2011_GWC2_34_16]|uniref:RNA-directed DNA polymerase n=2 Tax=Candidatus Magasanikiibacteriota TaxID=1752731 RepID=A0A0G0KKY3_9BACT|nr:MAG: RNA-directed DNA polymerase [Candidatus Magasanikbacteria bacterium GW2011_GWC2_34_16]KKQ41246.1 MAG: RNA-directed DNA polymerase [Candidatus Magasanikbacteria bacterium GW2011_GWA2_37_8]